MSAIVDSTGRFGAKGRELKIALGDTVRNPKVRNKTIDWPSFLDKLRSPVRTKETYKEYVAASKTRKNDIKDVGYYVPGHFSGGQRKKQYLSSRWAWTGDIDFAPVDGYLDAVKKAFEGHAWAVHSSHMHNNGSPRLRLIVPFAREVSAEEYEAVARKLAARLDLDWFDDTTFEFSRVMYWPSASSDGDYVFDHADGAWIDPDQVLDEYDDWADITQWPVSSRAGERLHKAAEKAEDPRTKRGVVGAFCRAYSIEDAISEFLSEVYTQSDVAEGRYSYAEGTTANGVVVYDDGSFLFSHHGTDPCGGRLMNAWDAVRLHKFGHLDQTVSKDAAPTSMPSFKAMAEWARDLPEVKQELVADIIGDFDDVDAEDMGAAEEADEFGLDDEPEQSKEDATAAKRALMAALDIDSNDNIKANLSNLTHLLRHDPVIAGSFGFNEFTSEICQRRPLPNLPVRSKRDGDIWSDSADIWVKYRLERAYKTTFSTALVREGVDLVAGENKYHPLREHLETIKWDGKPRVERLFIDYLGAEDTEYNRQVARKFMAASVARVFKPGTKFDNVLVLEGEQGARKSTFVRVLCYDWFTDSLGTFDDERKIVEATGNVWMAEIPELHAYNKATMELQKAFFSRAEDKARKAYARREQVFPRQFVLVMTTNDTEYLKDPTGNRRYWPVRLGTKEIDIDGLKKALDQLWAEAVELYRAEEPLYLTGKALDQSKVEQSERVERDDLTGVVEEWLLQPVPESYLKDNELDVEFDTEPRVLRDRVCPLQVWTEVMGGSRERYGRKEAMRIKRMLAQIEGLTEMTSTGKFGEKYGIQKGFWVDHDVLGGNSQDLAGDEFGL